MNDVQPIKNNEKLGQILEVLSLRTDARGERMYLMFMLGIHTGLRISDLVRLQKKDVCGEWIEITEKKTGKFTKIPLDTTIKAVIKDRCRDMADEDYLFPSRVKHGDGGQRPITTRCAYDDIKQIAKIFRLKEDIGCHTLRKTFGYWHYKQNKDLEILRQWFNHASQAVTVRYIGMDDEEKRLSVKGFSPGGFVYRPSGAISQGKPLQKTEPLDIKRLDRSKQGKNWGLKAQQRKKQNSYKPEA